MDAQELPAVSPVYGKGAHCPRCRTEIRKIVVAQQGGALLSTVPGREVGGQRVSGFRALPRTGSRPVATSARSSTRIGLDTHSHESVHRRTDPLRTDPCDSDKGNRQRRRGATRERAHQRPRLDIFNGAVSAALKVFSPINTTTGPVKEFRPGPPSRRVFPRTLLGFPTSKCRFVVPRSPRSGFQFLPSQSAVPQRRIRIRCSAAVLPDVDDQPDG
jgi:hypothetical protein